MDPWWNGLRAVGSALVLPGQPVRTAAGAWIGRLGVTLTMGSESVDLGWASYASEVRDRDAPVAGPGRWTFGHLYRDGNEFPRGVAVRVDDGMVAHTQAVRSLTQVHPSRLNGATVTGFPIPVYDIVTPTPVLEPRDLLQALCTVLARRPDLRERLDEPDRVRALAADLRAAPVGAPTEQIGFRRSTIEIHTAMQALRIVHPFGRPIEGEPLPDRIQLIERIAAHLAASPYVEHQPSKREIAKVLDRQHLGIAPWPFGALAVPAGTLDQRHTRPPRPVDPARPVARHHDPVPDDRVVPEQVPDDAAPNVVPPDA